MRGGQAFRASARRAFDLPPRWAEGPSRAATGPFPFADHRTQEEVETDEYLADMARIEALTRKLERLNKQAKPRIKSGATKSRAKARDEAAGTGHASERPAVERVSRPAAGRSAAATSEKMDVTAGETATSIPEPLPLAAPMPVVKRPAVEPDAPPASPPATPKPIPKAERLALPPVSGMEQLFTPKQGGPLAGALGDLAAVDDSKIYCAPCDHRVPRWFGRDCITANCPLKVRA